MKVLTVSQINNYIKALLDESPHLRALYIGGEISNFKHYPSGHMYFTLKDSKSQLKCVMFSSANYKLKFTPENGMKVICFGQVSVYERDGAYQLYVRDMQPQGIGSLTLAFEQLKEKLEKEGLFSKEHKKPLPRYPQKIGVATSNMGAAVEDIKNILGRRFPMCEVVIVPTVVQGDAAAPDIVKSIRFLDEMQDIDVIIVGRGGGSIEDLWAFNTEEVARAVFNCKTPIISAVGHETDFTICDFVADLRAPTPSAAAELAVCSTESELIMLDGIFASMSSAVNANIERKLDKLNKIKLHSALSGRQAFFEKLENGIESRYQKLLSEYKSIMLRCEGAVSGRSEKLRLDFNNVLLRKENALKGTAFSLNALSPLAVLSRGYSITKHNGSVINSVSKLEKGNEIEIILTDGQAKAEISEVCTNE